MFKKVLFAAVLLASFSTMSFGQNMKFGIKGGLQSTNLSGDGHQYRDPRLGIFFGGFGQKAIQSKVIFQPELLFSLQGSNEESTDENINMWYLNVPLMFKFNVAGGFNLEAGPQLGFLLSASADDDHISDDYNPLDLGLNFGASYNFTSHFEGGIRYCVGLTDAYDGRGDAYNRALQFSVGYRF